MKERVDALSLLSPRRIDILTRYRFMQAMSQAISPSWGIEMYREYLERCNLKSGYVDGHKTSFEHYLSDFSSLFISLKENGFQDNEHPIPVVDGIPINGAHRTAACIALKIHPRIEEVDEPRYQQTYEYLESIGYPKDFIDDVSLAYVELKTTTRFLMLVGGVQYEHEHFKKTLCDLFQIVGHSQFRVSLSGQSNLIKTMYSDNDWWEDSYIEGFKSLRFTGGDAWNLATIVFIDTLEDLVQVKEDLRKKILVDDAFKRRIHGSDNHFQTLQMAQSVLNRNSIHYLNNSSLNASLPILAKISKAAEKGKLAIGDYCLVGSSVMELYGIRSARDIDMVSNKTNDSKFSMHGLDIDAVEHRDSHPTYSFLNSDPRFFFWVNGIKVMSLDSLVTFKLNRGTPKDRNDLEMIFNFLSGETFHFSKKQKIRVNRKSLKVRAYTLLDGFLPDRIFRGLLHLYRSLH
jgi:hypothetical protein